MSSIGWDDVTFRTHDNIEEILHSIITYEFPKMSSSTAPGKNSVHFQSPPKKKYTIKIKNNKMSTRAIPQGNPEQDLQHDGSAGVRTQQWQEQQHNHVTSGPTTFHPEVRFSTAAVEVTLGFSSSVPAASGCWRIDTRKCACARVKFSTHFLSAASQSDTYCSPWCS